MMCGMVTEHRPERKRAIGARFTQSEFKRITDRARRDDRSLSSWVQLVVRDRLDELDAADMAADA
jgi:hypothetical protein